jgi:hypothetical protein
MLPPVPVEIDGAVVFRYADLKGHDLIGQVNYLGQSSGSAHEYGPGIEWTDVARGPSQALFCGGSSATFPPEKSATV